MKLRKIAPMNKKGQAWIGISVVILLAVAVIGGGLYLYTSSEKTTESVVQQTAQEFAQASQSGKVASFGVYVRDISDNDVNTKKVVPIYCQRADGTFAIDGTSSSSSAETTGKTTIGDTITCWAFNSTYQTSEPAVLKIIKEVDSLVIDTYRLHAQKASMDFYDDTLTVADLYAVNLSVSAGGSDSFSKLRLKNNVTDTILPVGGFYLDVTEGTNISNIDMSGSVSLSGMDKSSTQLVVSTLSSAVTGRKAKWDYVFEFDDDSAKAGNQALLLEEHDYLETGAVIVESSVGCTAGIEAGTSIIPYVFTKGYFRETKNSGVAYGHETDASSASVISTDMAGDKVFCA